MAKKIEKTIYCPIRLILGNDSGFCVIIYECPNNNWIRSYVLEYSEMPRLVTFIDEGESKVVLKQTTEEYFLFGTVDDEEIEGIFIRRDWQFKK